MGGEREREKGEEGMRRESEREEKRREMGREGGRGKELREGKRKPGEYANITYLSVTMT